MPGEIATGPGFELVGNHPRQRPCQDRQVGMLPGQHGGSGGGPVVRVPGKVYDDPDARARFVSGQLSGRRPHPGQHMLAALVAAGGRRS